MRCILFLCILFLGFDDNVLAQPNKIILSADAFIEQVKKYHPIAKQADLQIEKAAAEVLAAKGGFDPFFLFDKNDKTFDGKNYYQYNETTLAVPLPVGVIKFGLANNGGDLLDTEVSKGKSSYLGVELPLAKGLLMDKRRAALLQAKIGADMSMQERFLMRNNLIFEAYASYWQWAGAYYKYEAYSQFVETAQQRFRLIKITYNNGDRAMMDTLEAYAQLQQYELLQQDALVQFKNAGIELSFFLWNQSDTPILLQPNEIPEQIHPKNGVLEIPKPAAVVNLEFTHPILKMYVHKLKMLEVDQKLKRQNVLPYVSLKANLLQKNYNVFKNFNPAFLENNNKWGISLSMPLFAREARAAYKLAQVKIKETTLELLQKRQLLSNKTTMYENEYQATINQLQTISQMRRNYESLLRNETLKFTQGESSLFLVNSREAKLIEVLQKQIDISIKYHKLFYSIAWSEGKLK